MNKVVMLSDLNAVKMQRENFGKIEMIGEIVREVSDDRLRSKLQKMLTVIKAEIACEYFLDNG